MTSQTVSPDARPRRSHTKHRRCPAPGSSVRLRLTSATSSKSSASSEGRNGCRLPRPPTSRSTARSRSGGFARDDRLARSPRAVPPRGADDGSAQPFRTSFRCTPSGEIGEFVFIVMKYVQGEIPRGAAPPRRVRRERRGAAHSPSSWPRRSTTRTARRGASADLKAENILIERVSGRACDRLRCGVACSLDPGATMSARYGRRTTCHREQAARELELDGRATSSLNGSASHGATHLFGHVERWRKQSLKRCPSAPWRPKGSR